jgi:hypothetical protein
MRVFHAEKKRILKNEDSADPMLIRRNTAYPISFGQRQYEA